MDRLSQSGEALHVGASADNRPRSTGKFLLPLIALTAFYSIGLSVSMSRRFIVPDEPNSLYFILFGLFLTWWVGIDRHARGFGVPYDFDYFVLFAWPLALFYYLYRTRGRKGILFGVGMWGLCIAPYLVAATVAAFMYR